MLARMGFDVIMLDIVNGEGGDLAEDTVYAGLLAGCREGRFAALLSWRFGARTSPWLP